MHGIGRRLPLQGRPRGARPRLRHLRVPGRAHRDVHLDRVERLRRLLRDVHGHEGHADPEGRDRGLLFEEGTARRADRPSRSRAPGRARRSRPSGDAPANRAGARGRAGQRRGQRSSAAPPTGTRSQRSARPCATGTPLRAGRTRPSARRGPASGPTRRSTQKRAARRYEQRPPRRRVARSARVTARSRSSSTDRCATRSCAASCAPGRAPGHRRPRAPLEVSAIPVREALQLLQSEGLVVNVPHVGATVAPISRESILEVFTVMEGLEMVARARGGRARDAGGPRELGAIVARHGPRARRPTRHEHWADLNTRVPPRHQPARGRCRCCTR